MALHRLEPRLAVQHRHRDLHKSSHSFPTRRSSDLVDDQLFYLQAHGLSEEEAGKLIVNGFVEPITKELPMEYAVEMNRLIELQMEGSIG